MLKALVFLTVYLLVLVNLALGFVVFVQLHQLVMIVTDVLGQGGQPGEVGLFAAVRGSVSSISAILLGLGGMVSFPALEHYYSSVKTKPILLSRFLRVVGVELVIIATAQLFSFALVSVYTATAVPAFPLLVTLVILFAGSFLTVYRTATLSV